MSFDSSCDLSQSIQRATQIPSQNTGCRWFRPTRVIYQEALKVLSGQGRAYKTKGKHTRLGRAKQVCVSTW